MDKRNLDVLGEEYLLDKKEEKRILNNAVVDFQGLTDEEANKLLVKYFREVFGTEHGKIVLGVILEDLYYFNSTGNERTAALSDYAKKLLAERLRINNTKKIVDAFFNIDG